MERQNKSGITDKHRGRLFKCQIIKKVLRFEATERVEKEKLLRLAQNYSKFNDGVDFRETIISHLKGTNGYKVDEIAQEVIVKKLDSDAVHEYIINRAIEIQNEEAQKKADELNEPKRYSKRELHKRVRNYLKETYTTEHTKEIFDYHIKQALKRKEYHHRFIQLYMMAFESCNLNTNSDVMKHIEDEVFTIFTQQMYHCIEEYKVNVLKCKNIYKVFEKLQLERFRYDKALVEEWFTELGEDERRDVLYIINQFYVEVFNFVMQGYKDTILGKEKYERCSINGDDDDDSDDDE